MLDKSVNLQKNSIYVTNIECSQDVQKKSFMGQYQSFPLSSLLKNTFIKM